MPSTSAPHGPRTSRRHFLRTAAAAAGVGFTAASAGCSRRNLFSGMNVRFRTQALESPPVGLVWSGAYLVAAGRRGDVIGMDRGDGEIRWKASTDTELRAPPVSHDTEVYVAGEDVVSLNGASAKWRTPLPGLATSLTVDRDSMVVATGTEDGVVTAVNATNGHHLDADDGDRRWQTQVTDNDDDPARIDALAASGGVVYAGSRDGVAVALDAETGEERWRIDTATSAISSTGSEVLLGRRRVTSVRGGDRRWSVATEHNWTTEIAPTGQWYLTGSRVDGDGYVLALSPDGERRWRQQLTGDGVALTPVVNGRLVVGVEGERPGVQQFTTEGESAWFFETDTSVVDVVYTGDWAWALTASGHVLALSR